MSSTPSSSDVGFGAATNTGSCGRTPEGAKYSTASPVSTSSWQKNTPKLVYCGNNSINTGKMNCSICHVFLEYG